MNRASPLHSLRSIKLKWSIVIVAAVAVTATFMQLGVHLGWPIWLRPLLAAAMALLLVQFLAHGMTAPLRRMSRDAARMARGDYPSPVPVTSDDEVGELAAAFNRMAAELAEVDRTQKEFIANASHELRTPVTALRSTLENLVDGIGEPDPGTLGLMLAQAEHLSRLVAQLLDLSRLEAGLEQDLELSVVELGDLVHAVAAEIRLTNPTALIEIKAPLGLKIQGDEHRLAQVFTNIIGNGVRYSPIGSVVKVVVTKHERDTPPSARVTVLDDGPGIPEEHREQVFDRFWRADGGERSGGGSGLGLAISKRIVDSHEGTITIAPNPRTTMGTGTSVAIALPLDASSCAAERSGRPPQSSRED